jgi:hypothetical protein
MTDSDHVWIRTVPTDGRWCYHCAIAESQWNGDPCDGEGGIIKLEQQLIECRANLRSARAAIPGPDSRDAEQIIADAWHNCENDDCSMDVDGCAYRREAVAVGVTAISALRAAGLLPGPNAITVPREALRLMWRYTCDHVARNPQLGMPVLPPAVYAELTRGATDDHSA